MNKFYYCHFWIKENPSDRIIRYKTGLFSAYKDKEAVVRVMTDRLRREYGTKMKIERYEIEDMVIDYVY